MERKGGCLLVPRYGPAAGAGSGVAGQAPGMSWQMGRIMLKFRPIAPKPAGMAPAPAPAPVAAPAGGSGRGKRKAVGGGGGGGGGGKRGRKPNKPATVVAVSPSAAAAQTVGEKESEKEKSLSSRSSSSSAMTSVDSSPPSPPHAPPPPPQQPATTLPLMPVSPTAAEEKAEAPAPPVDPRPTAAVPSSWVTVEDVTSTWRDGDAPPAAAACSGADADSAPAFVSDRWGRVTWANPAFRRAVSSSDDDDDVLPATEGGVALAGALPAWGTCAGFTCRVRVARQRHASSRGGSSSLVAPCDVWRLDASGCYLWRLDLQAALTLGAGLP